MNSRQPIHELLAAYFSGDLDASQADHLRSLIDGDPALVAVIAGEARVHSALSVVFNATYAFPIAVATPRAKIGRAVRGSLGGSRAVIVGTLALAAVLVMSVATVAIYIVATRDQRSEIRNPTADAPIVSVIDSTGNLMVDDEIAHPGSDYAGGVYTLDSGAAEFLLANRVGVNLHGESRLVIRNPMLATLTHGSASFNVPAGAVGFTVQTPGGLQVIDLGTRFDLDVWPAGANLVRVTEGKVELRYPAAEVASGRHQLRTGEVVIAIDGRFETMTPLVTPDVDPLADGGAMTAVASGASWSSGTLSLHPKASYVSGAVSTRRPIALSTSEGGGFACVFDFECADSFATGADWIKFSLGSEPLRIDELATRGVAGSQQLAIVFDSYRNAETDDPSAAFVDVITPRGVAATVDLSAAPLNIPDLSDSGLHRVRLVWLAGRLSVSIDGREIIHELPIQLMHDDGRPLESVWLGFGAHTGGSRELHLIRNCWFTAIAPRPRASSASTEIHHENE